MTLHNFYTYVQDLNLDEIGFHVIWFFKFIPHFYNSSYLNPNFFFFETIIYHPKLYSIYFNFSTSQLPNPTIVPWTNLPSQAHEVTLPYKPSFYYISVHYHQRIIACGGYGCQFFFVFVLMALIIIVASRLPHVAIHINAIVRLFLITTNQDVISKITKKHHVCRKKKKKTKKHELSM